MRYYNQLIKLCAGCKAICYDYVKSHAEMRLSITENNFFAWVKTAWLWLRENKDWLFSGAGLTLFSFLLLFARRFFRRKNPGLAVKTNLALKLEQDIFGGVVVRNSPAYPVLCFEITNIGEMDIFVKDISWDFCRKKITYDGYSNTAGLYQIDPQNPDKYQKKLQSGEFMKGNFDLSFFAGLRDKLKSRSKIRLEVIDTLGRKYYSQKYRYREILDTIKNAADAGKN